MGDFVGMLQQVALAVGHIEVSDPTDLEHLYSKCTMESCENDMEFIARLATYLKFEGSRRPVRRSATRRSS